MSNQAPAANQSRLLSQPRRQFHIPGNHAELPTRYKIPSLLRANDKVDCLDSCAVRVLSIVSTIPSDLWKAACLPAEARKQIRPVFVKLPGADLSSAANLRPYCEHLQTTRLRLLPALH